MEFDSVSEFYRVPTWWVWVFFFCHDDLFFFAGSFYCTDHFFSLCIKIYPRCWSSTLHAGTSQQGVSKKKKRTQRLSWTSRRMYELSGTNDGWTSLGASDNERIMQGAKQEQGAMQWKNAARKFEQWAITFIEPVSTRWWQRESRRGFFSTRGVLAHWFFEI